MTSRDLRVTGTTTGKSRERRNHAQIIAVPGAAGSSAFWTPLTKRLPSDWDVRSRDLPGLGCIPAHEGIVSYDDLTDYVATDIAGPATVVAQSMGSYVALQLALRYPNLVSRIVLIAATGGVAALDLGAEDWRDEYASAYPHAAPWACAYVRDLSDDELRRIDVPVLLLWATHDRLSPLSVAHRLTGSLPDAQLVTFASNDHRFVHPLADSVATRIRDFVAGPT